MNKLEIAYALTTQAVRILSQEQDQELHENLIGLTKTLQYLHKRLIIAKASEVLEIERRVKEALPPASPSDDGTPVVDELRNANGKLKQVIADKDDLLSRLFLMVRAAETQGEILSDNVREFREHIQKDLGLDEEYE